MNWLPFGAAPWEGVPRTLYSGLIQYHDHVEPYDPDRVMRQFGFYQIVPCRLLYVPTKVSRPAKGKYTVVYDPNFAAQMWMRFPE